MNNTRGTTKARLIEMLRQYPDNAVIRLSVGDRASSGIMNEGVKVESFLIDDSVIWITDIQKEKEFDR